jgi:hypothetical protein
MKLIRLLRWCGITIVSIAIGLAVVFASLWVLCTAVRDEWADQ